MAKGRLNMAESTTSLPDPTTGFLTPDKDITGYFLGKSPKYRGMYEYRFLNNRTDQETRTNIPYPKDKVIDLFDMKNRSDEGDKFRASMRSVLDRLLTKDKRGLLERVIWPSIMKLPANIAGLFPDMAVLATYVPAHVTEFGAFRPEFQETVSGERTLEEVEAGIEKSKAETRKKLAPYGTEVTSRKFEAWARRANEYTQREWDWSPFIIGTDMTPEAYGWFEKTLSLALEFGLSGAAEVKVAVGVPKLVQEVGRGVAKLLPGAQKFLPQLAKKSVDELGEAAATSKNALSLIDRANLFYRFGGRELYVEGAYGVAAAVSSQTALSILAEADPKAADWLTAVIGVGGAFTGPVVGRSLLTGLISLPGVQKLFREGFVDPLFRPFSAAARFEQRQAFGPGKKGRKRMARVHDILAKALEKGDHVDQAAGLAFTTPELSRTEANRLRGKYKNIRNRLDSLSPSAKESNPEQVQRIERLLEKTQEDIVLMTDYANFQESVLHSVVKDQDSANRFFTSQSQRLVERREHFFSSIENQFKTKIDDIVFDGERGGTPAQHDLDYREAQAGKTPVYEATRRQLVMEGDPKGLEASELRFLSLEAKTRVNAAHAELDANMQRVLEDNRDAAAGRIEMWKAKLDRYLADRGLRSVDDLDPKERNFAGKLIRDTYEDTYREYRAFETAAYNRVRGLTDKVETDIKFPEGAKDFETGEPIGGMTPAEFAEMKFETLSRSQKFNLKEVPVQLAQLVGLRSVARMIARMQKAERAEGTVVSAESRIDILEDTLNDTVSQKKAIEDNIDLAKDAQRVKSEKEVRALQGYIDNKKSGQTPENAQAIDSFANDPEMNWKETSSEAVRTMAPEGLKAAFEEIRKRKRVIAELGEGVSGTETLRGLWRDLEKVQEKVDRTVASINKVTEKYLGDVGDVSQPTGRLASLDEAGNLIGGGASADDVRTLISEIGIAIRQEASGTLKRAQLATLQSTMEQLLDTKVFPTLDLARLKFAREASEIQKRIEGAAGEVLGKERGTAEVKREVETLPSDVLPPSPDLRVGETALRKLRTAATKVPPFVSIVRSTDADGNPTISAVIDEARVTAGQSLFDQPGVPFERVPWGQEGYRGEIRLREGAEPSPRSLDLAESILLERLALKLEGGVDSAKLDSFRNEHKAIIDFLEKNGRKLVPSWLTNTEDAAAHASVLNTLLADQTKNRLTELVRSGQLDVQNMPAVKDYLDYIKDMRRRAVNNEAVEAVFNAEAGQSVNSLIKRVQDPENTNPKLDVQEVLSLVRRNKAAEDGFKASFIGNLFQRATVDPDALIHIQGDIRASAFDPTKFRTLLKDPKIRMMIKEIFPDNPQLLDGLTKLSVTAFEPGLFTKKSIAGANEVNIQDALSMEAWSNLGRILGLGFASSVQFVNALVAAGAGARYLRSVGKNITGNVIKDIVIDAALNPRRALELAKRSATQLDTFTEVAVRGLLDSLNVPGAVLGAFRKRPGVASEVITEPVEKVDEAAPGPPASVPPAEPPSTDQQPAAPPYQSDTQRRKETIRGIGQRPFVPGPWSSLAGARPFGPSTPTGPVSPDTISTGQKLFPGDPLFRPVFNKGGIVSIKRKPRQLVG
jgi:hypothetical protein